MIIELNKVRIMIQQFQIYLYPSKTVKKMLQKRLRNQSSQLKAVKTQKP